MRGMLELDMRIGREAINPLPRNLDLLVRVFDNLLDLGLVRRKLRMT